MPSGGRRKRQPNRMATRKPYQPPPPKLRLAIATAPQSGDASVTLANDLRLVRSAVLYADEVELISPGVEMIGNVVALGNGSKQDVVAVLSSLDDLTLTRLGVEPISLPQWRHALKLLGNMTPEALDAVSSLTGQSIPDEVRDATNQAQNALATALEQFRGVADQMTLDSGADELTLAMEAGLLRLSTPIVGDGDTDAFVARYMEKLRKLIQNPRVHLLLDELTGSLVRSMINGGRVEPSRLAVANAGEAAVGSGLIARLPAFDEAPLGEVLDLRKDLQDPLSRYRRSVAEMATRLRVGPFDSDLPADVDHLYVTEVQPAIADLREQLADHGLVREVGRHLGVSVEPLIKGLAGSALALGATSLADLSAWVTAAASAAPAGIAAAQAAVSGVVSSREKSESLKRHDLFYLYEIDRRLS